MRAVKTNALLWAAVIVVIGLNEHMAIYAAVIGFLLAVIPALFAPRLVPVPPSPDQHQPEHRPHEVLYRMHRGSSPAPPVNPRPGGGSGYINGSGS